MFSKSNCNTENRYSENNLQHSNMVKIQIYTYTEWFTQEWTYGHCLFTHLVPNVYDFLVENKSRISDDCVGLFHTADGHFIYHFWWMKYSTVQIFLKEISYAQVCINLLKNTVSRRSIYSNITI